MSLVAAELHNMQVQQGEVRLHRKPGDCRATPVVDHSLESKGCRGRHLVDTLEGMTVIEERKALVDSNI